MTQPLLERMTFKVTGMDCAAEEQLVRMQLAGLKDVKQLAFDLPQRTVTVIHSGDAMVIEQRLRGLNPGATLIARQPVDEVQPETTDASQRTLLLIVLVINFGLFVLELVTGFIANSMGLVADSLDMLADVLVYGLSIYAVGRAMVRKQQVARLSGYFQFALAIFGLIEVARRFLGTGDEPGFALMIGISLIAMAGNVASLLVLQRNNSQEVHMKASWIFTSNDVVVNISVILAGVLVFITGSKIPDLLVGAAVFCLVGYGAFRILNLSKPVKEEQP